MTISRGFDLCPPLKTGYCWPSFFFSSSERKSFEKSNPSVVIQALKLGVVRRLFPSSRKMRERWGIIRLFDDLPPRHFWQRRFYDFNVCSARKRIEKLRYIHRNAVKRGLVETPDQWRWSSFRSYAYGETGTVVVNDWSVLKMKSRAA